MAVMDLTSIFPSLVFANVKLEENWSFRIGTQKFKIHERFTQKSRSFHILMNRNQATIERGFRGKYLKVQ